ncbi:TetR-like C-terminal domain-containing protein [Streptomyces sp. NPDC091215]|uniref:TetR-like C-terminal domain-containing protein n=1 Tax=Streptomyces sp. NPDC091215 TaxID=3155192 RepID=UPI00341A9757
MGLLAEQLGVRTPSLYKHVDGQEDLNRRIATLALNEAADAVGGAVQGHTGRDALAAAAHAFRAFVLAHPGRYAATIGIEPTGPHDPLATASRRLLDSFTAVLRGYEIAETAETAATAATAETAAITETAEPHVDHALRTLRSLCHGFATLQSAEAFQWSADIDESFDWLITFADHGLRTM